MSPEKVVEMFEPDQQTEVTPSRVLSVDDDLHVRLIVKHILESNGFKVDVADSAAKARNLLESKTYDLMLCDIKMPGESGMDLLRHVRQAYPDMAVIMVSVIDDPPWPGLLWITGLTDM